MRMTITSKKHRNSLGLKLLKKKNKTVIAGKRKTAVARIQLRVGSGKVVVNGKSLKEYFNRDALVERILSPLVITEQKGKWDIVARLSGGGKTGQAEALRFSIAKYLRSLNEKFRVPLKRFKLLTRDPRKVQRKLFGHKKARKSFQFSKR